MKKIFNKEYLLGRIKDKNIIPANSWIYECDGKEVNEYNRIGIWEIHELWCDFIDDNGDKYRLIKLENKEL